LNDAYKQKLDENQKDADDKTAKKRNKRQKNKKPNTETEADKKSDDSEGDTESGNEGKEKSADIKKLSIDDPLMKEPPKKVPLIIKFECLQTEQGGKFLIFCFRLMRRNY